MIEIFKNKFKYVLFAPLIINSIYNLINKKLSITTTFFFDLLNSFLIFLLLATIGYFSKKYLKLSSKSIGIVFYFYSFLVIDIFLLLFTTEISFNTVFIITNIIWMIIFAKKSKFNIRLLLSIPFLYMFILFYNNNFGALLTKNVNITSDVKAYHFDHTKNIIENSLLFSIKNSVFQGYPQYSNYFDSVLFKISNNNEIFEFILSSKNVLFFISILFISELKISNENKILMSLIFTLLILNSDFLQFLFTSSLMAEGFVSLFFAIVFSNLTQYEHLSNYQNKINFTLLGCLYLSKQFLILIVIVLFFIFLYIKTTRKYLPFAILGPILQEILYLKSFEVRTGSHHLNQIDLKDTLLDLILFRDLKIDNILTIINNLFIDKPVSYILLILIILLLFSKLKYRKFDLNIDLNFFVIALNLMLIGLLYISAWRNMELESPIRFILNFFHIKLVTIFLIIDKFDKEKVKKII